jgi:hypothetical protein
MIHDLDRTLDELLRRDLPRNLVGQVTISFDAPDDQFPPNAVKLPAVDLFLYDVRENRDLRSNEWIVTRNGDRTASKQRPPVRVDCSYLVTAWGSEGSSTPALDEHRLLGEVMKVLLRHATIPAAILQGDLVGQQSPLPAAVLQPGRLQSLGEFWQALGGKPKAALNYTVTIGVQPHQAVETGPPVTDKQVPGLREE